MGALELAKQFAKAKAAEKPLADAFTQAKRAATGEKARLLYNLFAEFAGHEVNSPNGRGVLDVTLVQNAARVSVHKTILRRFTDKEVKKRKLRSPVVWARTGEIIDSWTAWHDGDEYVSQRLGGPEKRFAQADDLMAHAANEIGEMLIVEDE